MTESPRIDVDWDELSTVVRLWIRSAPALIWRADEQYEQLKAQKRHDPSRAPDPRGDPAAYITDRFARLDWRVTRPEPSPIVDRSSGPGGRKAKA